MDKTKVLKKARFNLNMIAAFLLIVSALSAIMNVMRGNFGIGKMISLFLIGLIIFALFNGKKWAKNFILVISILALVLYIPLLIGMLGAGNFLGALPVLGLVLCLGYIANFMNSDIYKNYIDLSNAGVDIHNSNLKDFESIFTSDHLIDIEVKSFGTIDDYKNLLKLVLKKYNVSDKVTTVNAAGGKLEIETEEEIIPVSVDLGNKFFDKSFLKSLEFVVNRLTRNDWVLDYVYPNSKLNISDFKIAYGDRDMFEELKRNGYY